MTPRTDDNETEYFPDEAFLDKQIHAIEHLIFIDPVHVSTVIDSVQELALIVNNTYKLGRILYLKARIQYLFNNIKGSTEHGLQVLELAQKYHYRDLEALALNIIGGSFFLVGDIETARQLYQIQGDIAREIKNNDILSISMHDLALCEGADGNLEKEISMLQETLEHQFFIQNPTLSGMIYENIGTAYKKLELYKPAFLYLKRAYTLLEETKADNYIVTICLNFAHSYLDLGDFGRAQDFYDRLQEFDDRAGVKFFKHDVEYLEGRINLIKGNCEEAEQILQAALHDAQIAERYDMMPILTAELVNLYEITQDEVKASEYRTLQGQHKAVAKTRLFNKRLEVLSLIFKSGQNTHRTVQERLSRYPSPAEPEEVTEPLPNNQLIVKRLAHEFRTPLSVIRVGAEILNKYHDRIEVTRRNEYLHNITDRVDWMTTILDDILLLLQFNQSSKTLQTQQTNIESTVKKCLAYIEKWHGGTERVQLEINALPPYVIDEDLLHKILQHLLENGLKFSQGIVRLIISSDADAIRIVVEDDGIGIPDSELNAVKEMFYRASNIDESPGIGIGLTIVDQAVQLFKGNWQLESQLDHGTRVTVYLPTEVTVENALLKQIG